MTEVSEELFAEEEDSLLDALAATPDGAVLPRKTVIEGQYEIERVLGQGGMGVVYLARDLRLDREVAIKVGIATSAAAIGRLAHEALALARLSHPNVVVIYQVGELSGRSYVAMEYVPGGTARTWCEHRSPRDVIALYVAAGTGLAAAHASDLVHCDFKPDNVLVGADGRPRVADFGLARALTTVEASEDEVLAVAGTPAYMAPEQTAGAELDGRADQYAFCAALWEALFGVRAPERSVRPVPKHVEAALRRGMEQSRDDRWPSMELLLDELRRDPARQRRSFAIGGVALTLAALGIGTFVVRRGGSDDPCGGGEEAIAGTWSAARADQVRAAVAPAGSPPWLGLTAKRTVGEIEGWAQRWKAQHRAVCVASRAWSPALADRGVECLAQSRRDFAATVEVLLTTPGLAAHADRLFEKLGGPERCADAAYVNATVPPPAGPMQEAQVRTELGELAKIAAIDAGGRTKSARALATAALARVRLVGYSPLVARAQGRLAHATLKLGEFDAAFASYREGYYTARASRDAETAAMCASGSAIALLDLSRDVEAAEWAHLAEVEATTSADPASALAALHALTVIERARNEPERALADAERYVLLAKTLGASPIEALRARSGALDLLGKYDAALADLDEAIRITIARDTQHPLISDLERERALVLLHLHRPDDAVAASQRAVSIAETTQGPDSHEAIEALAILGVCLKNAKREDEALVVLQRSVAVDRVLTGPRSYNVASDMNDLADLMSAMGRLDEAMATWTESRAIFVEVVGPEGNEVGIVDGNIANAYITAGRIVDATEAAALALVETSKTPDSPIHAQALIASGMTRLVRHDLAGAKAQFTQGLAKLDDDPRWRHRAKYGLAQIELAAGHPVEARTLATAALVDARVSDVPTVVTAIEQMLARLPREKQR